LKETIEATHSCALRG